MLTGCSVLLKAPTREVEGDPHDFLMRPLPS